MGYSCENYLVQKKNITNTFICPPGQNAVIDGQCIGMCLVNILVSFKKQLYENFLNVLRQSSNVLYTLHLKIKKTVNKYPERLQLCFRHY